ncbi:MAG: ABC transporter ATP-binding protein [Chlorobaculum sp.]|jgi:iron complex transport system ATP-binding protein|nr:ABC transporter ATP-binding protein [Chlorobaculum sp.]
MVKAREQSIAIRKAGLGYNGKAILDDVDLQIAPGEIICLLGQNGAGKTTLFRTMLGFIAPLRGSVSLAGREVSRLSPKEIARIVSYVPQSYAMPFAYSVTDVVLFGRSAHLGLFASPGSRDRRVAAECLDLLEIAHLASRPFNELSGGERQMVVIARALAQEARFMILDEPASNLDYGNQVRVIRKIRELAGCEIGILMATHHPDHAFMAASRVAVLSGGRLSHDGTPEAMLTPETLRHLYGVEVQVFDTPQNGHASRRVCAPVVE